MKPMLLCRENPDLSTLPYPVYVTPKLDGIRALVNDGVVLSRTLKPIPNLHVQSLFGKSEYEGFDGELIFGSPTSPTVYRDTNSFVMSIDKVSDQINYHVFDMWNRTLNYQDNGVPYAIGRGIVPLPQMMVGGPEEMVEHEEAFLSAGYEGLIIRCFHGMYKFGRTTMKEQNTYKLKRFEDSEAEILGTVEEMENTNVKLTNELGRGQRSVHREGMVGKGTMGALHVRDTQTGVDFHIGSGFTAHDRTQAWPAGTIVKYKFFPVGIKDKPRHPIFLGIRDKMDM